MKQTTYRSIRFKLKTSLRRVSGATLAGFLWLSLSGFGSEHSSATAQSSYDKANQSLSITFTVKANEGMKITPEGPWSLSIKDANGLSFTKAQGQSFESKAFDESIPGFRVQAKVNEGSKSGTMSYKIRAFICTEDKTRCYPQTLDGTHEWKL